MKEYYPIIRKSPLFTGFTQNELENILHCLSAVIRHYKKNQVVLYCGDKVNALGMVLTGSAYVIQDDFWGNQNIISDLLPGQIFAESYACRPEAVMEVTVQANEPTTVMFLNVKCISVPCSAACDYHSRLIRNLLSVLANKYLMINEKMTHMAQRSTREKLLSYLYAESVKCGSHSFLIPFNRQQLADYLAVNRSAMCTELGKMREEGILEFDKNHFILHNQNMFI